MKLWCMASEILTWNEWQKIKVSTSEEKKCLKVEKWVEVLVAELCFEWVLDQLATRTAALCSRLLACQLYSSSDKIYQSWAGLLSKVPSPLSSSHSKISRSQYLSRTLASNRQLDLSLLLPPFLLPNHPIYSSLLSFKFMAFHFINCCCTYNVYV